MFYRKNDVNDLSGTSLGLSSSDVSYLKDYEPMDLGAATLDHLNSVDTDVDITSKIAPDVIDSVDSGQLHQQFTNLKIPDISVPQNSTDFIQASHGNLVGLLNVPNVDDNFTRSLKVVGTINVPFTSTILTNTVICHMYKFSTDSNYYDAE